MKIHIKATNFELTPAIKSYIEEKVGGLEKFIHDSDSSIQAWVEVGLTTKHHQKGDIYRAEIQISLPHIVNGVRVESEQEGLYAAIDEARDEMKRELIKVKEREKTLIKRGARLFKKIISFSRD